MTIHRKYSVYEFNKVMGSKYHQALKRVEFKGFAGNSFSTEEQAIQALIDDGRSYEDFAIIREVFITEE